MTNVGDASAVTRSARELLAELELRGKAGGLESQFIIYDGEDYEDSDPGYVRLAIRNGRSARYLSVSVSRAKLLLETSFETFIFLGDFEAFVDTTTGVIEAQVVSATSVYSRRIGLWSLPGVEILDPAVEGEDEPADDIEAQAPSSSRPDKWRLRMMLGSKTIEISPPTDNAQAIWTTRGAMATTIKLSGFSTSTHDEALAMLESVGNALLFEIDVLYNAPYMLVQRRVPIRRGAQERANHAPMFPKNEYSAEALALYQYARSANGLPLLEYLAYYQSLEFFFPVFAREHTVKSLRTALLSPKFNPTDDSAVNRLINLAAPAIRAGVGEREQLRATVRACVEVDELKELVESSEAFSEHFSTKKQSIRGVNPIRLQGDQMDIRDQVADRIYAIRCRVVHTKQDGSGLGEDILLPSSAETRSLQPDIALVRLVAQRTLFARAVRTSAG